MTILRADARRLPLADDSVDCCVTAPPFWSLSRERTGIGHESTPQAYVESIVGVMAEVWRVLKPSGTLWLNLGDSYAQTLTGPSMAGGFKRLDMCGIPWSVAIALRNDGWYLRSEIILRKPRRAAVAAANRPRATHEQLFLFAKSDDYHYDRFADLPSVWAIRPPAPRPGYDYLPIPPEVARRCLLAGCPPGGLTLDPFAGLGTVGRVARELGRRFVGCEIDAGYARMATLSCAPASA